MHNRKGPRPSPPQGSKWIEDAATHLGLELTTLRKWRLLGKDAALGMPGYKVGRYVAYRIADLDAYLERQYQAAITPAAARARESRPAEPRIPRQRAARAA